jgi:hypothetical protein
VTTLLIYAPESRSYPWTVTGKEILKLRKLNIGLRYKTWTNYNSKTTETATTEEILDTTRNPEQTHLQFYCHYLLLWRKL